METTEYANNIFEQPWWLNIVAPGEWDEVFSFDKEGNICARLAYVKHGKGIIMPKYTQTLGIWMREDVRKDYGIQKTVINELFTKVNSFRRVNIRLAPENKYILPFRWMGYRSEPFFTYRIDLQTDIELLYNSFNKTAKKNIKSANNKVVLRDKSNPDVLLELLEKTFKLQGRKSPYDREIIENIIDICDSQGNGFYLDAIDKEGNVHSCAYFVYDENVCYYLIGAADPQYRSSGSQSMIIWQAIQTASSRSSFFDFEGSMIEGIENFFRQFGGDCIPYYEIRKNGFLTEVGIATKPYIKKILGYKI